MEEQKQVGEYNPRKPAVSEQTRVMRAALYQRRDAFVRTGIGLIAGNFIVQALPGMHDWKVAVTGSVFVVVTLIALWDNLRADEGGTRLWVKLFHRFQTRRSK